MANISDLWPEDSSALALADREQGANVWLSHSSGGGAGKDYGIGHTATAGGESPKGTWALSL